MSKSFLTVFACLLRKTHCQLIRNWKGFPWFLFCNSERYQQATAYGLLIPKCVLDELLWQLVQTKAEEGARRKNSEYWINPRRKHHVFNLLAPGSVIILQFNLGQTQNASIVVQESPNILCGILSSHLWFITASWPMLLPSLSCTRIRPSVRSEPETFLRPGQCWGTQAGREPPSKCRRDWKA